MQLVNPENRSMLQRLGIQNIIVWDDIGGYVLANTVADNNYLAVFCQLAQDREKSSANARNSCWFIGKALASYPIIIIRNAVTCF